MKKIENLNDRKDIRLTVRVTNDQYELVKKQSAEMGLSEAEYIRRLLEQKPVMRIQIKRELNELREELHHASNNLNQIAKALNGQYYHFPEEAEKVNHVLEDVRIAVKEIIEAFQ